MARASVHDPIPEYGKDSRRYRIGDDLEAVDVMFKLGLRDGFCLGNAIKYIVRACNDEDGIPLVDLKKARHYLGMLIQDIEGENK